MNNPFKVKEAVEEEAVKDESEDSDLSVDEPQFNPIPFLPSLASEKHDRLLALYARLEEIKAGRNESDIPITEKPYWDTLNEILGKRH